MVSEYNINIALNLRYHNLYAFIINSYDIILIVIITHYLLRYVASYVTKLVDFSIKNYSNYYIHVAKFYSQHNY